MRKILLILSAAVTLSACTASLYPLVGENDVHYVEDLQGAWKGEGVQVKVEQMLTSKLRSAPFGKDTVMHPVTEEQKRLKRFYARSYLISYAEKGIEYVYEARITRIGTRHFAEFLPYSIANDDEPRENLETGYAIARIEFSGNKLSLLFIDGDKIRQLVQEGKLRISYEHEKLFDHFIITANTQELRQFLYKYGGDERLFNKRDVVILTR